MQVDREKYPEEEKPSFYEKTCLTKKSSNISAVIPYWHIDYTDS